MSIVNLSVPAQQITAAMSAISAPHLEPIMVAVRDHGVGLCVVPQGAETFDPPRDRPMVVIVGDDMTDAKGPAAFHRRSLRRFIKRCRAAVVVACAPLRTAYASAAATAAVLRRDVILIETRPEHEADWVDAIKAVRPGIAMIIVTIEPAGGVH